ncbi:MAG: hypothetical protein NT066_06805, partial [Candidatus Omnitrophica bacterium]|nr:hypothetical protein [Candidatus Omnitrophota bacterium]
NFNNNYAKDKTKKTGVKTAYQISPSQASKQGITQQSPAAIAKNILNRALSQVKHYLAITIFLLVMLTLAFMVTMTWLTSRLSFVFLEDVIKNDAAIKIPFKAHKKLGDSLFNFNLIYSIAFLTLFILVIVICVFALGKLGVFDKAKTIGFMQVFFTCLPYGLLLLGILFMSLIIYFINNNFVLVVMFKDKIKILQALSKALAIIKANKLDVIKYLFIQLGLGICAHILYACLSFATFLGLLLPVGVLVILFRSIFMLIPAGIHLVYFIVLFTLVTPLALFLLYAFICLGLPFGVFSRTLSLKFIARLDPHYNLFRLTNEEVVV